MHRFLPLVLSLVIVGVALLARWHDPAPVVSLRLGMFDAYQRWRPRQVAALPVRVVDIDEDSVERLGQWPWPRNEMAALVIQLAEYGAAAIVFDVVFSEPDRTSPHQILESQSLTEEARKQLGALADHDRVLAQAFAVSRAVTGISLADARRRNNKPAQKAEFIKKGDDPIPYLPPYYGAITSLDFLDDKAKGSGVLNFSPDPDGVVRRVPLLHRRGDRIVPSLSLEAMRVAQGRKTITVNTSDPRGVTSIKTGVIGVPTDRHGRLWIHYGASPQGRTVPAWKVLAGQINPKSFEAHIVLVGVSAAGLHDLKFSPLGAPMASVEIQAQIVEQILSAKFLSRPVWSKAAELIFLALLGLFIVGVTLRFGPLASSALGGLAVATAFGGSAYAFSTHGLLLDPLYPAISATVIFTFCTIVQHVQKERESRWIYDAFSAYVSPNLVEQLISNPEQMKLGGERRELTFLFTDLAGFTPMVEQSEPGALIPLLNEYLNEVIGIGFKHGGTLDAIVGDATTFFFNAPVQQPDHPDRAFACALELDAFAHAFAEKKHAQGLALGETRIGVHTGPVIIGNMGGDVIFNYAAHGDAINVAARLESANKQLGTRVCISVETASRCKNFAGRPVGALILKGKTKGIVAFEPLPEEALSNANVVDYLAAYDLLLTDNDAALSAFREAARKHPDDPLIAFRLAHLERGETGIAVRLDEK